jgi:hypothetical protein
MHAVHIAGVFVTLSPNAQTVFFPSLVDASFTLNRMDVHGKRTDVVVCPQGSL